MIGTSVTDGASAQVDLRIQDGTSSGTIILDSAQFEITRVGEVTYVKADGARERLGIPPEMHRLGRRSVAQAWPAGGLRTGGFSLDSFASS